MIKLFLISLLWASNTYGEIYSIDFVSDEKKLKVIVVQLVVEVSDADRSDFAWIAEGDNPVVILPSRGRFAENIGSLKCLELAFGRTFLLGKGAKIEVKSLDRKNKIAVVGGYVKGGCVFLDFQKKKQLPGKLRNILSPYDQVSNSKVINDHGMKNFSGFSSLKGGDIFVAVRHSTLGLSSFKKKEILFESNTRPTQR